MKFILFFLLSVVSVHALATECSQDPYDLAVKAVSDLAKSKGASSFKMSQWSLGPESSYPYVFTFTVPGVGEAYGIVSYPRGGCKIDLLDFAPAKEIDVK